MRNSNQRALLFVAICAVLLVGLKAAFCQSTPGAVSATPPMVDSPTLVPLWPQGAPGAQGPTPTDIPTLTTYLPAINPTKTAVIIAPVGGYRYLEMKKEGEDMARWLNARGIAAFVLKYRLAPKYRHPIEIDDARRAIRTVRANAGKLGISPEHIGICGFSAGGHLAATAGTQFDAGVPDAADPIERQSSRPDFLILAYALISFKPAFTHIGSRNNLIGIAPDPALVQSLSAEAHVTPATPPAFLYATSDDKTVPVMNSVLFYEALVAANVPAEMHLYRHGSHGSGLAIGSPLLKGWPDVLAKWMAGNGWMTTESAAIVTTP